jgi:hypothetical protein
MSQAARVLLLSRRNLSSVISRCCPYEFEDVIREVDAAELVAPPYLCQTSYILDLAVNKLGRKVAPLGGVNPGIRAHRVTRDYELFFAVFQFATDAAALNALPGWRERCGLAACWLEEIWARDLGRLRSQLALLRRFDVIFTNCLGSVAGLAKATGRPVLYQPPGVDALTFYPGDPPVERVINVFNMGRRHPATHQALLDLARERRLLYLYDTFSGHVPVQNPAEHRLQLANLIKRSRFFIANRAKANAEGETGRQEELGFRFFEGAAGGAVMIGEAPGVTSFREHFDWPDALVPLPFSGARIGELIAELEGQPERLARIRRDNVAHVLRRHDWAYRWRAVLEHLGLSPPQGLREREARLSALAARPIPGRGPA